MADNSLRGLTFKDIMENYFQMGYGCKTDPLEIRMNENTRRHIGEMMPRRNQYVMSANFSGLVETPAPLVDTILGARVVVLSDMADGEFKFSGSV